MWCRSNKRLCCWGREHFACPTQTKEIAALFHAWICLWYGWNCRTSILCLKANLWQLGVYQEGVKSGAAWSSGNKHFSMETQMQSTPNMDSFHHFNYPPDTIWVISWTSHTPSHSTWKPTTSQKTAPPTVGKTHKNKTDVACLTHEGFFLWTF